MVSKRNGFIGLGLFAALVMPAAPALAKTEVSTFKLRASSLIANFQGASDANPCLITQTSILFTESVEQVSGTRIVAPPTTQVEVDYADTCTGESFTLAGGTTAQSVSMANDLSTATMAANVFVTDGAGHDAQVAINVAWTANAPGNISKDTIKTRGPDSMTIDHFKNETRAADLSGSVSTVLNLADGPTTVDLSRFPEGGQLGKNNDGQRTVTFFNK